MFLCCSRRIKKQQEPVIKYRALLRAFDGDTEFVTKLLYSFVVTSTKFSCDLESSLKYRDYPQISQIAHALKGTAANVMCDPISIASADLECYTKGLKILQAELDQKVRLVLKEIKRFQEYSTEHHLHG